MTEQALRAVNSSCCFVRCFRFSAAFSAAFSGFSVSIIGIFRP